MSKRPSYGVDISSLALSQQDDVASTLSSRKSLCTEEEEEGIDTLFTTVVDVINENDDDVNHSITPRSILFEIGEKISHLDLSHETDEVWEENGSGDDGSCSSDDELSSTRHPNSSPSPSPSTMRSNSTDSFSWLDEIAEEHPIVNVLPSLKSKNLHFQIQSVECTAVFSAE